MALSEWEYVSIFRNHGKEAGASLSHANSQIIATPIFPKLITDKLTACMSWFERNGVCPYCAIIESEHDSPRFIYENRNFIAFALGQAFIPSSSGFFQRSIDTHYFN